MESNPELEKAVEALRSGKVRPLTEQQARWVSWYKSRFEDVLEGVKNLHISGSEKEIVKQLASLQLLTRIARSVDHVAHGIGLFGVSDGVLKFQLSIFELGGHVGKAIVEAKVYGGHETATFLESLLSPFQIQDGLPDDIKVIHERYIPIMYRGGSIEEYEEMYPDTGRLRQYEFSYFVIVPFPN